MNKRPLPSIMLLLALSALLSTTCLAEPSAQLRPKVLVIGIDGCRHDAVVAAHTPHIDRLVAHGTRFLGTDILSPMRTDSANTVSGPGWSNLLTGVWPDKHGVVNNKFVEPHYDLYPHFFSRVKEAHPASQTASFSDWGPIAEKILSHADHAVNLPADGADDYTAKDKELTAACCDHLRNHDPDAVFLYLGQVDESGHAYGFHPTVAQYIAAIERVDSHIGEVLESIEKRNERDNEEWLVVICTDHGGAGTDHGDGHTNPDIRRTFMIVGGDGAEQEAEQVQTYQVDVVATVLTHLRIPLHPAWKLDGHAVGLKHRPTDGAQ